MEDPGWPPRRRTFARGSRPRPASALLLDQVEVTLSAELPSELREMYMTSDGLWDEDGQWFVIWPVRDVLDRNAMLAEDNGWAQTDLVAFGDDGTGNPFCFSRRAGSAVFYWSHIDAKATHLAASFADFWRSWTLGTLPAH